MRALTSNVFVRAAEEHDSARRCRPERDHATSKAHLSAQACKAHPQRRAEFGQLLCPGMKHMQV